MEVIDGAKVVTRLKELPLRVQKMMRHYCGSPSLYLPELRLVYVDEALPHHELLLLHERGHANCHAHHEHFEIMDYEMLAAFKPSLLLQLEACAWRWALGQMGRPLTEEERDVVLWGMTAHVHNTGRGKRKGAFNGRSLRR